MNHSFALGIMQVWLAMMSYGWFKNRDGSLDKHNYDRFHGSSRWHWLLSGQDRAAFLRQRRLFHRLTLPFVICFYMLGMWGILAAP